MCAFRHAFASVSDNMALGSLDRRSWRHHRQHSVPLYMGLPRACHVQNSELYCTYPHWLLMPGRKSLARVACIMRAAVG